jgi:hypothetical protein
MATTDEGAEFYRWYGAWGPLYPQGVAMLMNGFYRQDRAAA